MIYDAANLAFRRLTNSQGRVNWGLFEVARRDEFDCARKAVDRPPILDASAYNDFCPSIMYTNTALNKSLAPKGVWRMRGHLRGSPFREGMVRDSQLDKASDRSGDTASASDNTDNSTDAESVYGNEDFDITAQLVNAPRAMRYIYRLYVSGSPFIGIGGFKGNSWENGGVIGRW